MSSNATQSFLDGFGGMLNWPGLNDWLSHQSNVPGSGPVTGAQKLAGGLQNAVFLIERGSESFILRRPSKHVREGSNETMLREARILGALGDTPVPLPDLYSACADVSVIGTCFYTMQPLEGFARSGELPGHYATEALWRRDMSEGLIRAAASLGSVDPAVVGLADLGKPDQWHSRQVSRWRSQLDGYRTTPGYGETALPHVDEVGGWLTDNLPSVTGRRIGIVHGDLQFPNVMFSLKAPRVSGILDWELASQGDPLLDLGWILSSWYEDGDPAGKNPMVRPWNGFLSRTELVRLYGELSGRDMSVMPWYFALACYKLACLLEGTYARSLVGQVPPNVGTSVHTYAVWLMTKARQITAG